MKNLMSLCCIAAVVTAFADTTPSTWTTSGNLFGILRIDSTTAQTIVSVPWECANATAGTAIKVKDIVKTANLTAGDQLYCYSGGSYKMWQLDSEAKWVGATVVSENGLPDASAGADETINRGDALILIRQKPTEPGYFFVHGQYTSSGKTTTCVANGWTLLASPLLNATDLNQCTWANVGPDDRIYVPVTDATSGAQSLAALRYKDGNWGIKKGSEFDKSKATIPVGLGVWYVSKTNVATTVTWATTAN